MIQQHFVRSPSLREKLSDQYAGVELATGKCIFFIYIFKLNVCPILGMVITIIVVLAIFCISTISGRLLFYLLLCGFIVLILCLVSIYWVQHQKRQLVKSQISSPLSKENLYVYGIRFNPLPSTPGLGPERVIIY